MLNCCQLQPQPRLSLERICPAIDQLIWQANLFFLDCLGSFTVWTVLSHVRPVFLISK